jgi:hypothetical protein
MLRWVQLRLVNSTEGIHAVGNFNIDVFISRGYWGFAESWSMQGGFEWRDEEFSEITVGEQTSGKCRSLTFGL